MQFEELNSAHAQSFLTFLADVQSRDAASFTRWFSAPGVWDEARFIVFVREAAVERHDWRPRAGRVSLTRYVLVDDDGAVAGFALLRFPLDTVIERDGGNFVVVVPPSRRGQGFGTLTLNRLLFEGARAGLARALVTCDSTNVPARQAIERNRGRLEGEDESLCRYWIPLR